MRVLVQRSAGAALLAFCALMAAGTAPARAQKISLAETILFQSKHFGSIKKPTTLNYTFHQAENGPIAVDGKVSVDIAEMKRLTGGAAGYFRKRIRLALAASEVPVKKIKVPYRGSQVSAQEITIYPYLDDPLKERLGKYVSKGYVFITSEAVPGTLYRAYTTMEPEDTSRLGAPNMVITLEDKPNQKSPF